MSHDDRMLDEYERRYMHPDEKLLFREKVVSHTAFRVSVVFSALFALAGIAAIVATLMGAYPRPGGLAMGVPFVVFGAAMGVLGVMFSVFRTMVTNEHLHVHFGFSKTKIPLSDIETVKNVKLVGFKQGKVTVGLDGVVHTTVGQGSSGRGVDVTYRVGTKKRRITIGSDDAERFVASVEGARARVADAKPMRVGVDEGEVEERQETEDADVTRASKRAR